MLKTLWRGWLVVARTIGAVQSRLILTLVYFVFMAPFALGVRLFSDPLGLRTGPSWHSPPSDRSSGPDLGSARQQF